MGARGAGPPSKGAFRTRPGGAAAGGDGGAAAAPGPHRRREIVRRPQVALGYQIGAVAVANALLKDNLHLSNRAPSRGRPGAAGPRRRVFAQAS